MTDKEIRAMRRRKLIPGAVRCEKYVFANNGRVLLVADNWQAMADVMERIFAQ